jgi:hypothetical protein
MWILILTLVAPSVSGGRSIASVPGFTSEQVCHDAGNHWLRNRPDAWAKSSAICVKA